MRSAAFDLFGKNWQGSDRVREWNEQHGKLVDPQRSSAASSRLSRGLRSAGCDDCLPDHKGEQYEQAFEGSGPAAIERKRTAGGDPTHGEAAAARRAEANITRKRQAREWDERHGKLVDLSALQRDILPLIQNVPLSRLQRATGLSLRYVSLIRRGERVPHPRHWASFSAVAGSESTADHAAT